MKYSVSSYSFSQRIKKGEITQKDTVRLAAEMGFEGIEFTDLRPDNRKEVTKEEQMAFARELKAEAEKYGIAIVAYAIGANLYQGDEALDRAEVERLKGQVDVAAEMGCSILRHDVCYSLSVNGRVVSFDRMLPVIAANVREVTAYAQTRGVRTCSENHGFIAQDSERVERLYNAVGHDNYGLLVDVGNFSCVDEDSPAAVSRVAPYAIHVHVKDMLRLPYGTELDPDRSYITTRGANHLLCCTLGEGSIPVRHCLAILKRAGYDGWISLEYEGWKDCMTEIPLSLPRMKEYVEVG